MILLRSGDHGPSRATRSLAVAALAAIGGLAWRVRVLERQVLLDPKTGLLTYPAWVDFSTRAVALAARTERPVAVLALDVDGLKPVNDASGHLAGDAALGQVAQVLRDAVRASDAAGRFGGDEFMVLLADAGLDSARVVAERIRKAVEQTTAVTVSIGIACGPALTLDELVAAADAAVYEAKRSGGNAVSALGSTS